jgi:hypothetical protein
LFAVETVNFRVIIDNRLLRGRTEAKGNNIKIFIVIDSLDKIVVEVFAVFIPREEVVILQFIEIYVRQTLQSLGLEMPLRLEGVRRGKLEELGRFMKRLVVEGSRLDMSVELKN